MSKNVLITGTSSGFGLLMTQSLARAGHNVIATMRDIDGRNKDKADQLRKWADSEGVKVRVTEMDVADDQSVITSVESALKDNGGIDVVVNNAGIGGAGVTEGFSLDQGKSIFEVNFFGSMRVTNAVLPSMRKNKDGLVIFISSGIGRLSLPFTSYYCGSKFALEAVAESLYNELQPLGVDAVIVEPGAFPTEFSGNMLAPRNANVVEEYGEVAHTPQKMFADLGKLFESPQAPNPQEVADKVQELIEMPKGKRPMRSVVDPLTGKFVEAVNRQTDESIRNMINVFSGGK